MKDNNIIKIDPKQPDFNLYGKISRIIDDVTYGKETETTFFNESKYDDGKSAMLLGNKKINITPGSNTSVKIDSDSNQEVDISFQKKIITNRYDLNTNEIVVNGHQFNPVFYEYTDYKTHTDQYRNTYIAGDLCVSGSIMVKAWDHNLKKYVLIRRPARFQMFAPKLNVPEIHEGLGIEDPSKYTGIYQAVQTKSVDAETWFDTVSKQKSNTNNTTSTDNSVANNKES